MQVLSLTGLTNLEELRLKRNKISTLNDGAFWPLKNLILLQLDFNMLTTVKKGGLFGLEHLKKLTLSHNHIKTIESQAWDNCGEITELLVKNIYVCVCVRQFFLFFFINYKDIEGN